MVRFCGLLLILGISFGLKGKEVDTNYFIENKGQWHSDILFLTRVQGMDVWITKHGVTYDAYQVSRQADPADVDRPKKFQRYIYIYSRKGHVFQMKWQDPLPQIKAEKLEPLPFVHHYYLGSDKSKWKSDVKLYREVIIHNVYEGIDIRWYFQNHHLRYDFIVHPYADVSRIQMRLHGISHPQIINNELVLPISLGEIKHTELKVFQQDGMQVQAQWLLHKGILSYKIGDYDRSQKLIIDPLLWSTFILAPGPNDEEVRAMTRDKNFNPIITGTTTAQSNFPTTVGAYTSYPAASGETDIFIMKLNTNNSMPIFSAFFGGDDFEYPFDIYADTSAVNPQIYVTGSTKSVNMPTTPGAYNPNPNLNISTKSDIFIFLLAADGSALISSTYFGGDEADVAYAIDRQSNGKIVITGETNSTNLPTTPGAYSPTPNTGLNTNNVFVAIFNASLTSLANSTFIGGSTGETAYALTISYGNQVIIAGEAKSVDYPTVAGGLSQTSAGMNDAFVSIFSSDLATLEASTYFGGSSNEVITDIALQQSSFVATGYTNSNNLPTTVGAYIALIMA